MQMVKITISSPPKRRFVICSVSSLEALRSAAKLVLNYYETIRIHMMGSCLNNLSTVYSINYLILA